MKINLREELSTRPSKNRMEQLFEYLSKKPSEAKQLFKWIKDDDMRLVQSAAWLIADYYFDADQKPDDVIDEIIDGIQNPKHPGVARSMFRILQNKHIPERVRMTVYELCLERIASPAEAIAVRAFAMTTAVNIARQHPELAEELSEVIRLIEEPSPGIKVRIRTSLKALSKLTKKT